MHLDTSVHQLFAIPVWEVDLREALADRHERLVELALDAIRNHPAPQAPFRQSLPNLAHLSDEWNEAAELMVSVAQVVLDDHYRRRSYRIRDLRSWVLAVDGSDAWDAEIRRFTLLHNHPNSTLSSVLYLDIPGDIEGSPDSGTVFSDPLGHVTRETSGNGMTVIPGKTLRMLVFPSWLEHGPARPLQPTMPHPRLTVAADYLTES